MSTAKLSIQTILLGSILSVFPCQGARAASGYSYYSLTFKGKASGGTLIIGRTRFHGIHYVSIETSPGESAESVARRLANQIKANHTNADLSSVHKLWIGRVPPASGASVKLLGFASSYYLADTETGLGIPEAPMFLTCVYDEEAGIVRMAWDNPPGGYDQIIVSLEWSLGRHSTRRVISGDATSFVIDQNSIRVNVEDLYIAVVGLRDNIVSSPAAMHMSGHYQDEAFAIPFGMGVMPNWDVWRASGTGQGSGLGKAAATGSGGRKLLRPRKLFDDDVGYYTSDMGIDVKPFYQVIEASPSDQFGMYRKFLGLTPGHTYRITAAFSTLQMHLIKDSWSLSVCAVHNGPGRGNLKVEQLAGEALLPNGKMGPGIGRIMSSRRSKNITGANFRIVKSKSPGLSEEEGMDVTLPPGIDTLTVWVRFKCSDPAGRVGFMGSGIEDVTASGKVGRIEN